MPRRVSFIHAIKVEPLIYMHCTGSPAGLPAGQYGQCGQQSNQERSPRLFNGLSPRNRSAYTHCLASSSDLGTVNLRSKAGLSSWIKMDSPLEELVRSRSSWLAPPEAGSHAESRWECDLNNLETNSQYYDEVTRTYLYSLSLHQADDVPLEPILHVTFLPCRMDEFCQMRRSSM